MGKLIACTAEGTDPRRIESSETERDERIRRHAKKRPWLKKNERLAAGRRERNGNKNQDVLGVWERVAQTRTHNRETVVMRISRAKLYFIPPQRFESASALAVTRVAQ